jgi:two-component system, OmpR family, phosphate regulon sensor histidine kinase PhoR
MARLRADQKLFLSYIALIAAVVVALTIGVGSTLRANLVDRLRVDMRHELLLARDLYARSRGVDADALADRLGMLSNRRVTVIAPDGRVLGDSERDGDQLARMENHLARPEVRTALAGGVGESRRVSASIGTDMLYMAVRTGDGAVIRMADPMRDIYAAVWRVQRGIFGVGLVALVLTGLLSLGFSVAITKPLRHIVAVARAMSAGELSRRARLRGTDELGELADVMDALAEELQQRVRQLEGERGEMQALIDAMAEAVIAWDPAGNVQRTNPAARFIFGLEGDGRGLSPEAVARRPAFLEIVRLALAGRELPPTELAHDGRQLLVTARPLADGGAVMVFLDLSELRRLEDVRRDFVANASHELKTPLTAIRGFSETLLDDKLPPELRRKFAETVKTNADRLQRIVDDLLDLSRIESGGYRVQPEIVSVAELAADALAPCRAALDEKRVDFRVETPPEAEYLFADPAAVRQVLTNLISNAIRYVPAEGGCIVVESRLVDPSWVEVSVLDNGSGIPSVHLPRIFERFYRADAARSREEGGTGLGLAIVKHLIEAHGGSAEAESQLGAGTTIRLRFPAPSEDVEHGGGHLEEGAA